MSTISLRCATSLDTAEIVTIYAHYVRNGTATFEEIPLEDTEMAARIDLVQSAGYPWRVAVINGLICGYAYENQHKARSAYRFTVENSVHIALD